MKRNIKKVLTCRPAWKSFWVSLSPQRRGSSFWKRQISMIANTVVLCHFKLGKFQRIYFITLTSRWGLATGGVGWGRRKHLTKKQYIAMEVIERRGWGDWKGLWHGRDLWREEEGCRRAKTRERQTPKNYPLVQNKDGFGLLVKQVKGTHFFSDDIAGQ